MAKGGSGIEKRWRLQCRKMRHRMVAPRPTATRIGGSAARVSGMQAKLHRWAVADPGRRFDDLFNLVHDPAHADRGVATGSRATPGPRPPVSDGWTVARIERGRASTVFLDDLRGQLKAGTFRPQPVRERKIPNRVGREGAPARDSDGRGPGRPGGAETGAGTDLRGRLRAGLLWVPARAARTRRDRRDPPLRHPGLPVGAGRGYRGVLRHDRPPGPDGPGAGTGQGQARAARWSRRSSRPGSSPNSATRGHPHRHAARGHPVPAAGQHRAVGAR